MIFVFIFVSGDFDSIFDFDKIEGNKNDKACFRPFPFRFQPYQEGDSLGMTEESFGTLQLSTLLPGLCMLLLFSNELSLIMLDYQTF